MKYIYLLALVVASSQASRFKDFVSKFRRNYVDPAEELARKAIYNSNVLKVLEHNKYFDLGKLNFSLEVNKFADMSLKEFNGLTKGLIVGPEEPSDLKASYVPKQVPLPAAVDWRTKGAVTPVKNQGKCGSCYTFTTTGVLEGQWFRKTGNLTSLSEQQILDCSTEYGNKGCQGGFMVNAYKYIRDVGGLQTGQDYPYTMSEGTCEFDSNSAEAKIRKWVTIARGDEKALQNAVANVGPVAIGMDSSSSLFQLYAKGIYSNPKCSSENIDHAVLVVGYGTEKGVDYWLIKNSWGTSWGEDGYFRLVRNKRNHCGVASLASYPIV